MGNPNGHATLDIPPSSSLRQTDWPFRGFMAPRVSGSSSTQVHSQQGSFTRATYPPEGMMTDNVFDREMSPHEHGVIPFLGDTPHVTTAEHATNYFEGLATYQVLVVDDSALNNVLLVRLLKSIGFVSVLSATDGVTALTLARQNPDISLILTDLSMPLMDGMQLTTHIRAEMSTQLESEMRYPIIIALSGAADENIELSCLQADMDALLPKPATRDMLIDMAHFWLLEPSAVLNLHVESKHRPS